MQELQALPNCNAVHTLRTANGVFDIVNTHIESPAQKPIAMTSRVQDIHSKFINRLL